MLNQNIFTFLNFYTGTNKRQFIKNNRKIKILNRNIKTSNLFQSFTLAVHNGLVFIPVYIDINKINYMLATFAFSFGIKLKKTIRVYKKKKKRK